MKFETERLNLRPIRIEDKIKIFEYRSDSETNKFQSWIPKTIEDVEEFIGKNPEKFNEPESWFQFVIIEKDTNKLIGDLGVHFISPENKVIEIGCTLNKKYHNKGFASEALRRIIDYNFKELKKHRIVASIDPDNKSSIRLIERLGFRKEAHFVESIFINGQWVDDFVYALLESEWGEEKKLHTTQV